MRRHNEVIGELRNMFKHIPDTIKFETLLSFMDTRTLETITDLVKTQERNLK